MIVKSGESTQKENNQIHLVVKVGDKRNCPECKAIGSVVWVSQDKTRMAIQCHASHRDLNRPVSRFGAAVAPSTRTRKNVVFITSAS